MPAPPASYTLSLHDALPISLHSAVEDHAFIPPFEALIREVYASGKPMVGICFGHQIMAQALGGKVERFKGGWGLGPTNYTLTLNDEAEQIR